MSSLARIPLNESAELDFGIEISGTEESVPTVRFIIEGPDYDIVCRCTESQGVITAQVPRLHGILPAGNYPASIEVIVEGRHFRPLSEEIQFTMPVSVTAKAEIKTRAPDVKLNQVTVRTQPVAETTVTSTKPVVRKTAESADEQRRKRIMETRRRMQEMEEQLKALKRDKRR